MTTICNRKQSFYQYLHDWEQFIKTNRTIDWSEDNEEEIIDYTPNDGFEIVKKKIRLKNSKKINTYTGKLYRWVEKGNFGFIMPNNETNRNRSVWVHISKCIDRPKQGSNVTFEIVKGNKGITGKNVRII